MIKKYKHDYIFLAITIIIFFIYIYKKKEHFNDNEYYNLVQKKTKNLFENETNKKFEKLYYNVPLDINSDLDIFDKSVLKNYRINPELNSYGQELEFSQVYDIISKINSNKNYKIQKIGNINVFAEHFNDLFNKKYFELMKNNKYHKNDKRKYYS